MRQRVENPHLGELEWAAHLEAPEPTLSIEGRGELGFVAEQRQLFCGSCGRKEGRPLSPGRDRLVRRESDESEPVGIEIELVEGLACDRFSPRRRPTDQRFSGRRLGSWLGAASSPC
jgi:hypothetical protein